MISPYWMHFKTKKYFQAPLLVLQLVTNRGISVSISRRTSQYLEEPQKEYWGPGWPKYSCHGSSRYWFVLPDANTSPIFVTRWSTKKRSLEVLFVLRVLYWHTGALVIEAFEQPLNRLQDLPNHKPGQHSYWDVLLGIIIAMYYILQLANICTIGQMNL